jgi:4-amino-4-deoxy-L-arabinose transferase-like glycosyltransferase
MYFRISHFDTFPPDNGQLVEEYQTGSYALLAMESSELDSFFPMVNLIAETGFRLFGISLEGMRWAFVIWSILGVCFFIVAAHNLFRSQFAVFFSSMLFASNAFLAGSSRISMETMSPVTTVTFVCMSLALYYSRRDTATLILTGLALGLVSTEYFSFKLISLIFFIFLLWNCISRSEQSHHGKNGPISEGNRFQRSILLISTSLFMILPTLIRPGRMSAWALLEGLTRHKHGLPTHPWTELLGLQFKKVLITFRFVFLDGSGCTDILPSHYGLLDMGTGLVLSMAFIYCLLTCRNHLVKTVLTVTSVLIVFLSGFLVLNPQRYRLIPLIPIAFLMIGFLIDYIHTRFRQVPVTRNILITAGLVVLVLTNYHRFFHVALHDESVHRKFYDFNVILSHTIAEMQAEHPDNMIYLFTNRQFFGSYNAYRFLYKVKDLTTVSSLDELPHSAKYLICHDSFMPDVTQDRFANCTVKSTRYNLNTLCICEFDTPPQVNRSQEH